MTQQEDRQLGVPFTEFRDTKSNITLTPNPLAGMVAYATDTGEEGYYNGLSGTWIFRSGTSGGVSAHNDLTGLQGGQSGQYYHLTASQYVSGTFLSSFPTQIPPPPSLFEARISLASGTAVTSEDLVGQGTLWLNPFKGNVISLHNGILWLPYTLPAPLPLTLSSLATGTACYDIFVYSASGTVITSMDAVGWTSPTVRATAPAYLNGVEVKNGATNRKYAGTVYIDASKQATMEWDRLNGTTKVRRHVWNRYNQVLTTARHVSTASHIYSGSAYRKWNGGDDLTHEIVIGLLESDPIVFAGGQVDDGARFDVAINWISGGGELVDLRNDNPLIISAFTGGGLRRNRIVTPGLVEVSAVQQGNGTAGTFGSGVLEVGYFS